MYIFSFLTGSGSNSILQLYVNEVFAVRFITANVFYRDMY